MELVRDKRLVPSPKWCTYRNFIAIFKSFVYNKNRRVPRTDPCGTSYAIGEGEEL